MLILGRFVGEVITIGDDVEIMIVSIKGREVRVGINAPKGVAVDRKEIAERKRRERKEDDE